MFNTLRLTLHRSIKASFELAHRQLPATGTAICSTSEVSPGAQALTVRAGKRAVNGARFPALLARGGRP